MPIILEGNLKKLNFEIFIFNFLKNLKAAPQVLLQILIIWMLVNEMYIVVTLDLAGILPLKFIKLLCF